MPLFSPTVNLDYDDLKQIIKDRTTDAHSQPRFIPGHGNENQALKETEDQLYRQLLREHERVSLFVRSKVGELERRLGTDLRPKHSTIADIRSRSGKAGREVEATISSVKWLEDTYWRHRAIFQVGR